MRATMRPSVTASRSVSARSKESAAQNSLFQNTVHVKIYPTPFSFGARREVLRVLESYGVVTSFRGLKYDYKNPYPNAWISTYASPSSVKALLSASPIRYRYTPNRPPPDPLRPDLPTLPASSSSSSSSSTSSHFDDDNNSEPSPSPPSPSGAVFSLHVSPSTFPHAAHVRASPLHGPWTPLHAHRSVMAADLAASVPRVGGGAVGSVALRDWMTERLVLGGQRAGVDAGRMVGDDDDDGGGDDDDGYGNDRDRDKSDKDVSRGGGGGHGGGSGGGRGRRDEGTARRAARARDGAHGAGRTMGSLEDTGMPWRLRARLRERQEMEMPRAMRGLTALVAERESAASVAATETD